VRNYLKHLLNNRSLRDIKTDIFNKKIASKFSKLKKPLKGSNSMIEVTPKKYNLLTLNGVMDVLQDLRQLLGSMEKLLEVSCLMHWTPSTQKEIKMGQKFLEEIVS